jgi:LmbE family N-acetylglucosaminyl deacetylase
VQFYWVYNHNVQIETMKIENGEGRTILLVSPHADDPAFFLGGVIALWAEMGWRVICVRVTDDRWDSHGLSESQTIENNTKQFQAAASVLGISEIVEFGYNTDVLGDVSEVALREKIIRMIRTYKPYALVSFDPFSMYGEDNEDHLVVAKACNEAFWTSQFDLHHPEHFQDGLQPHGCFERWYFGRRLTEITHVVDISSVLDKKVLAAQCHVTMMLNYANQLVMQARTAGKKAPLAEDALRSGDPSRMIDLFIRRGSQGTGARYALEAAEEFRIIRFGGLSALLED